MSDYYVVTEDGDSLHTEAADPREAADNAVREWGLEADPGLWRIWRGLPLGKAKR